ncbi:MAG: dihydropteroate synthase [Acidobacteria bacterium]|jgi:dihydropteroate synthase|nr:dihydropteroate synthase [Acidobacteriota bacterium]
MKIHLRNGFLEKPAPLVMGILNVTPDSFSDAGRFFAPEAALAHARALAEAGADIIDVGGESTRPGAVPIGLDEEIDRVLPIIARIKEETSVLVSIDTSKEEVARLAVEEGGADLVNDISAFRFSERMASVIAELNVPVVLMHILGTPETMQRDPSYADVIAEISDYFQERIDYAVGCGILKERIILDPGIGFGKRLEDNVAILCGLKRFGAFDLPLLIGLSRKSFLGQLAGEKLADRRDPETIAANLVAARNGAAILRVHDVAGTVKALKVWRGLGEAFFQSQSDL